MPSTRSQRRKNRGKKKESNSPQPKKKATKKSKKDKAKKQSEKPDVEMKAEEKVAEKKVEQESKTESKTATDMQVVEPEIESKEYNQGLELMESKPAKAMKLFRQVINQEDASGEYAKIKENAVYSLGKILAKQSKIEPLKQLLTDLKPFFGTIPKARTAKIVRKLIDISGKECKDSADKKIELQSQITQAAIEWCTREKRTFLKQRMECRMAALLLKQQQYKPALKIIARLVREVKKFDDKLLLVEIELIEARVHLALQNVPKAKGALTAARSSANAVYCPPLLQAQIDLMAGTLCATEKDYKTAFSYFYEAFEGYNTINDREQAVLCLKYMLLGKIMTDKPEDVYSLVNGKAGVKYAGVQVQSMKEVADAYKKRSIDAFQEVYDKFKPQLAGDPIINSHLTELKDKLLEQNLLRLIEPFSRVQMAHVAKLIHLPLPQVEAKLSEMILDKKLAGILDQGSGDLIVFDEGETDKAYDASLETIKELSKVVDKLYFKAQKFHTN